MAKSTKPKKGEAGYVAPVRKAGKVRTAEQLRAGGLKDNMYGAIRIAINLSKKNGFGGTPYAGKKFSSAYQIYKPGGRYWNMDEGSDTFKSLRSAMSAAVNDIAAGQYTDKVQKAVTLALTIPGAGGTGARSTNFAAVKDFKF